MHRLQILILIFYIQIFKLSDCQNCQIAVVCGADFAPGWMQYNSSGAGQTQCSYQSQVRILTDRLANLSKRLNDVQRRIQFTSVPPTALVVGRNTSLSKLTTNAMTSASKAQATTGIAGNCELRFNGSCYWASLAGAKSTDFASAQKLCTDSGGRLAGIYSFQHFASVHSYIFQKRGRLSGQFTVWTGLIVTDETTGTISLPNNSSAPNLNRITNVRCQSGQSRVIIRINSNLTTSGIGITGGNCRFFGTFCESRK